MRKLTKAQRAVLKSIAAGEAHRRWKLMTWHSLEVMGLLRMTHDGELVLTDAGSAALAEPAKAPKLGATTRRSTVHHR